MKVSIASLSLDPKNARKHSDKNLSAIAASLNKFGQRKPIVVHNGVVLAGNGTLEAAKSLGWTDIEISEVPSDWDDDTAKAYALADNRTAELAEWDESELAKQLLELQDKDWDITELGFEQTIPASTDEWADALEGTVKEQSEYRQWAFSLSDRQYKIIENAVKEAQKFDLQDYDNVNKNANALTFICEQFNVS